MDPVGVVVILKLLKRLFQIGPVPEKNLVQVFTSDGADEPLGEGMRYRHMGNGFNRLSFTNSQIRPPLVVAIQGIVVRTEIAGHSFPICRLMEHPAKGRAIDIASMHRKSNDSPGELIHDDEDPVGLEEHGFTPEQIDAPKAVLYMSDEGEPGGAIPGIWPIMLGEDTSHNVLVDIDAKSPCDLLCDPGAAKPGIPAFHLQNELDKLKGWSLGARLSASSGGVEEPVFSLPEYLVKLQDRRWPDDDGRPLCARWAENYRQ